MTCVVGIESDRGITIAADSAASNGHTIASMGGKVFTNGDLLIGSCGSIRMKQILRYGLVVPALDTWDIDRWMATAFVDAVRHTFKTAGYGTVLNGEEKGGTFLVGVRGRLYTIYSDYQANRKTRGYHAIGSGEEVALGAMYAARDLDPEARALLALEAAAEYVTTVAPPFDVMTVGAS